MRRHGILLLCLASCAAAQYNDPYYNRNRSTPGRVIAGIVIAICIALLLLCMFSMAFRRRRRGLTAIPTYNGGLWGQGAGAAQNPNQGPYRAYPMASQEPQHYQPPPGPPPQNDPAVPPPYPGPPKSYGGEENSGYGYPNAPEQGPPKPGGFIAPNSPPQAHVHDNSPWAGRSS